MDKKYPEMNEEERKAFWEWVANWYATPDSLKVPQKRKDIWVQHGIKENNFYYHTQKKDFKEKVIQIALTKAKDAIPNILGALQEKAIKGDMKGVELYLKYVAELADKTDITSKGEKIMFLPSEVMEKNGVSPSTKDNS